MRINLFGGPGSGKSTAAARLFGQLRVAGYQIELIHEFIKPWCYRGWQTRSYDQLFVLANQIHAEDTMLTSGVPHLVTDAPLFLQAYYAKTQNTPGWELLVEMARHFDTTYPATNIFLDRAALPYRKEGRYQDETQAREYDTAILDYMNACGLTFVRCETEQWDRLLNLVTTALGKPNT